MILLALAAAASAASPSSPEAFVAGLYAHYRRDPDYSPLNRPSAVFAPRLAAAIRRDEALSNGEIGFLDGDPLCDCQDVAGLGATIGRAERRGPAAARIAVTIRLAGDVRRRLILTLARIAGAWRIADVAGPGEPSLLADIERENRRRSHRG